MDVLLKRELLLAVSCVRLMLLLVVVVVVVVVEETDLETETASCEPRGLFWGVREGSTPLDVEGAPRF
jgi:hypothetical protein